MAYANTVNTLKHSKHALKYGNYGRVIMGTTSHIGAGMARLYLYKQLFNFFTPDETSSTCEQMSTLAWNGVLGGILINFYSPYAKGWADDMAPAITETISSFATEMLYGLKGLTSKGGKPFVDKDYPGASFV